VVQQDILLLYYRIESYGKVLQDVRRARQRARERLGLLRSGGVPAYKEYRVSRAKETSISYVVGVLAPGLLEMKRDLRNNAFRHALD